MIKSLALKGDEMRDYQARLKAGQAAHKLGLPAPKDKAEDTVEQKVQLFEIDEKRLHLLVPYFEVAENLDMYTPEILLVRRKFFDQALDRSLAEVSGSNHEPNIADIALSTTRKKSIGGEGGKIPKNDRGRRGSWQKHLAKSKCHIGNEARRDEQLKRVHAALLQFWTMPGISRSPSGRMTKEGYISLFANLYASLLYKDLVAEGNGYCPGEHVDFEGPVTVCLEDLGHEPTLRLACAEDFERDAAGERELQHLNLARSRVALDLARAQATMVQSDAEDEVEMVRTLLAEQGTERGAATAKHQQTARRRKHAAGGARRGPAAAVDVAAVAGRRP